ncbi:MAG: UDP-N-acetylglucosamine 2-epimerase (non-hydrolyzing) [Sphingobacteriales bacterium]|nr:UDP-N-acetylglucosamine 2-epimerase (non-hydrolyzing) [Sphingobacteriales bacterium]
MTTKRLLIVVGTRPNFIKVSQFRFCNQAMGSPFDIRILHTSQHHDSQMAEVFFKQIRLDPDIILDPIQGSPIARTATMLAALEDQMLKEKPDLVLVVGDVDSTFAGAWVANRLGIPCAHVESGLRSRDRSMPEEINRILTDHLCDHFFVTEPSGSTNLLAEGKHADQISFAGNTMIDTLVAFDEEIQSNDIRSRLGIQGQDYLLMTMHRPATVDNLVGLQQLASLLEEITRLYPIVFPVHPRTRNNIKAMGLSERFSAIPGLLFTDPLDYFAFQALILHAKAVITDSGGVQEETTFRGVPCLTLRPNTERPVTVEVGTNVLVSSEPKEIIGMLNDIGSGRFKKGSIPQGWDGHATARILEACVQFLKKKA